MEHILRVGDVAAAIRGTLFGTRTKAQLGKWAHLAMLADDAKTTPYDPEHWSDIHAAIHQLIFLAEGPDYEIDDEELRIMMERLEHLGMVQ